jgi:hypothetical protein
MDTLLDNLLFFWSTLPSWLQAVPSLAAGWLLAFILRHTLTLLCALLFVNRLAERVGLSDFLRKGNVTQTPSQLLGLLAYWLVLGATLVRVAKLLDLDLASTLVARLLSALPELVSALLVCVLGFVCVKFLGNLVRTLVSNAGYGHAEFAARCVRWAGFFLVFALAIDQLGFAKTLLSPLVHIVFGAVALALALAFGLGCKDIARDFTQGLLRELRERSRAGSKSDLEG